jgi:hypothetical protein
VLEFLNKQKSQDLSPQWYCSVCINQRGCCCSCCFRS